MVYIILKHRNRPYRCIHKHHHQLPVESAHHLFFYLNFHYRCNGHYIWYTLAFFQLCNVCVLHTSRLTLPIKFQFFHILPILGEAFIIASWRYYLNFDDTSVSLYFGSLRYIKPNAFRFLPIEEHQRWFRLGSYFMAAVLAAASYSIGGFSLCLSVSARHVMVPGVITFHLEPGTIHPWWNLTGTGCLWCSLYFSQISLFSIRDRGGGLQH